MGRIIGYTTNEKRERHVNAYVQVYRITRVKLTEASLYVINYMHRQSISGSCPC